MKENKKKGEGKTKKRPHTCVKVGRQDGFAICLKLRRHLYWPQVDILLGVAAVTSGCLENLESLSDRHVHSEPQRQVLKNGQVLACRHHPLYIFVSNISCLYDQTGAFIAWQASWKGIVRVATSKPCPLGYMPHTAQYMSERTA